MALSEVDYDKILELNGRLSGAVRFIAEEATECVAASNTEYTGEYVVNVTDGNGENVAITVTLKVSAEIVAPF